MYVTVRGLLEKHSCTVFDRICLISGRLEYKWLISSFFEDRKQYRHCGNCELLLL
jgi:hypothetical protein